MRMVFTMDCDFGELRDSQPERAMDLDASGGHQQLRVSQQLRSWKWSLNGATLSPDDDAASRIPLWWHP